MKSVESRAGLEALGLRLKRFVSSAGGSVMSPFYEFRRLLFSILRFEIVFRETHLIQIVIGLAMFTVEFANLPTDGVGSAPTAVEAGQTFGEERHDMFREGSRK